MMVEAQGPLGAAIRIGTKVGPKIVKEIGHLAHHHHENHKNDQHRNHHDHRKHHHG